MPTKKDRNIVLACPKCAKVTGHSDPMVQKLERGKEPVVVIGKVEKAIQTLPTTKVICPRCGHDEASYWMVQTRGGDEASTQFFRCTKCGRTWREYS